MTKEEIDFDVEYSMYKNFKKVHYLTSINEENKWNKSKFTLFLNGKFEVEFAWNQEVENETE